MRAALRLLDAAAVALAVLVVAVLATGGGTVLGVPLTRAEDVVVALTVVVGARLGLARPAFPDISRRAVVVAAAVYAVVVGFITVTRHLALRTHALDLGYYVQVVWSMASGRGASVTLPPMHAWGDHLSPVLYLLAPVAWAGGGGASLVALQTLTLAAGALAVFRYGRARLGEARVAAALALLYLVNPSLHGINLRDLHPQAFAIPLLIGAAAAFDARRYGWCVVALVLTLGCREDAAIAVVGFAIWLGAARGRWALGAALAGASVLLLAADINVVMPYFRGEPYPHLQRYAHLGSGFGDILVSLVARPWRWLPVVVTAKKLAYLVALLAPLGFLPLLAPAALAAALPGLAMNLLSLDPVLFHYRSQYQSFILPFLVLGAVEGCRRFGARARERRGVRRVSPGAVVVVGFLASVVLTARTVNDLSVARWRPGPDQRAAYALMRRVPPSVPVSADERLVPHLATRPEIYLFPAGLERSEYVLARESEIAKTPPPGFAALARDGAWVLLRRRPGSG